MLLNTYIEGKNLDTFKNELREYVKSGHYYNDISKQIDNAKTLANRYLDKENIVILFDKDETLLSTWDIMQRYDFGWPIEAIEEAQKCTTFRAITPVLNFFNYCKEVGFKVHIMTSERAKYLQHITAQLESAGITGYDKLIVRPDDDTGTIYNFKVQQRKQIIESGLTIAVNIGDQWTDLNGEYCESTIKIPNRFYAVTEDM